MVDRSMVVGLVVVVKVSNRSKVATTGSTSSAITREIYLGAEKPKLEGAHNTYGYQ